MQISIEMTPPSLKVKLIRWFSRKRKFIKENLITILLISFSLALILLVALAAIIHFFFGIDIPHVEMKNANSAQYWGQLGDFVGGMLNPFLSFAALMAVLFSLQLQKKELRDVRAETVEANRIQNDQTAIYRRQGVESSLLSLIDLHCKITDEVIITQGQRKYTGRLAFKFLAEEIKSILYQSQPSGSRNAITQGFKDLNYENLPLDFYKSNAPELSRYMKSIFQVIKFIDSRIDAFDVDVANEKRAFRRFTLSYFEKRQFSSIFRAQLDQRELQLIFLNILTPEGQGLKYYVEKYSLLKGMNLSVFSDHAEYFDEIHNFAFADYEDIDLHKLYSMDVAHKKKAARAAFQRSQRKDSDRSGE